jgi:hypothetical protein
MIAYTIRLYYIEQADIRQTRQAHTLRQGNIQKHKLISNLLFKIECFSFSAK